jgi:hypothetical protein
MRQADDGDGEPLRFTVGRTVLFQKDITACLPVEFGIVVHHDAAFLVPLPYVIYKKSATFLDRFKAVLQPGYFAIEHERGERSWKWEEFSGWIESPHFFHLYFNSRSFFLIPKEAFEGDDVHEARKIFSEKLKKS